MNVTNLLNLYALEPWMSPNPIKIIRCGAMDVTKPYNLYAVGPWMSPNLINSYALVPWMSVTKP